jgi:S1-C subfamily serine protease
MANHGLSLVDFSSQLAELVERSAAFVVTVDGRHRRPGSGIIVGPDLVVTADHVLERDDHLAVRVGDRRLDATLAGRDPASDVAVLRVPGLGGTEPPRAETPRAGELVVSLSRTGSGGISSGIGVISAIGGPLRTPRGVVLRQVLRTDAAARPGTSGGAIVSADGRVIAMTTSGLLRGLPVGIPADQLWGIASALASSTPMKRAYLGVSVQPVRFPKPGPEDVEGGLLVFGIAPEGAADRAGLLVGDVIVGFADSRLAHADDLQDRLASEEAGARRTLSLVRGGALQRVDVTLGARPSA